jgi:hypothetical protein
VERHTVISEHGTATFKFLTLDPTNTQLASDTSNSFETGNATTRVLIQTFNPLLNVPTLHPSAAKFRKFGHWPNTIAGHYLQYLLFKSTNIASSQLWVVQSDLYIKEPKSSATRSSRPPRRKIYKMSQQGSAPVGSNPRCEQVPHN